MTDAITQRALREAIRADVRERVDRIVDRLERQVHDLADPEDMAEALRIALAEVCDAVAEGLVAQVRENKRTRPRGDLT